MRLDLTSLKLNTNVRIGSISSKREQILDGLLMELYPEKQKPLPDILAYINSSNKTAVLVGSNQININIDSPEELSNFLPKIPSTVGLIQTIIDQLLLDGSVDMLEIDLGGTVKAHEEGRKSASNKSLQKFCSVHKKTLEEIFKDIIAVGLRFVFQDESFMYDCRVEPLLAGNA